MRKISCSLMLCWLACTGFAQQKALEGFQYGTEQAPTGKEWESPESLSLNKEQPRAYFFSFQDVESARKVLPDNSTYWKSLNGQWKFHWAPNPEERPVNFYQTTFDASTWDNIPVPSNWNIVGVQKDGSLKYGVPIYVNQPVIFQHKVAVDDWRGGVMRTPPENWTTFKHRNEVGSYIRTFDVPENWDGREIYLSFDGVDSFFYLWINGQYVGFSKNSRNAATFNITPYLNLKAGATNKLAVEVYRNSDASYLEAQDMFRLPGIFRTVALYSVPKVHIRNMAAIPDLDATYTNGELNIKAEIRNLSKKDAKKYQVVYSLYANKLYDDANELVANASATAQVDLLKANESLTTNATMKVANPNKWSAEEPYRYTLVAELKNAKGKTIETASTYVGFRKVEIKETPANEDEFGLAGRYYYLNGQTIKLKGVNRHESNPALGHAITHEIMENEVMLMKKGNINHVRNSHYPDDPYWYYLCDKYGIYLEDEANIESHEYYYGAASLSHPIEWEKAHVARVMEMVYAHINNPSIVIWSLGNEAGPGKNFVTAYNALKEVDKSRPVQYERNNDIVDMGSNQYPSIAEVREGVKGNFYRKYPFHISEYAHSMGNACGNLDDYWEAIESTNFICGGAIWDWVDQAMYHYDAKSGQRYMAYGGDFGDTPNDGQFVMNGIVFADLEPKPQYYEVKKVYQNIGIKAVDVKQGTFEIFNKQYFKDLSSYELKWSLFQNGKEIKNGIAPLSTVEARKKAVVSIPYDYTQLKNDSEYFVKLQLILKNDMPWAKKGYAQMEEQILVKEAEKPAIGTIAQNGESLKIENLNSENRQQITGGNFNVVFDNATGTIYKLVYGNETIIKEGDGPTLCAFRAFTNNDNRIYEKWFEQGLHNLKHTAISKNMAHRADGSIILSYTVVSQAPNAARIFGGTASGKNKVEELTDKPFGEDNFKFTTNQIWTIYKDGSIELEASIVSNQSDLILPRLGYMMRVPQKFGQFDYYGRGPIDNYADRKAGQNIEWFKSTVEKEFVNFPKPQCMGNHEDVRWCALTDKGGKGVLFAATDRLSVTALPYSQMDMTLAGHPYQLPKAGDTYLHLDAGVTGLGGNSCGQGGPLKEDRIYANLNNTGFIIRPVNGQNLSELGNVAPSGECPIAITRARDGEVTISSIQKEATFVYTINNNKKSHVYEAPFNLREGGTVTAWKKETPEVKTTFSFAKIESIRTEAIYASSEESGEGDAKHLTDNDPNTYWHSMYSVTVAKHPYWIDLDAGEEKLLKGFTYLPRTDSPNGNVKGYSIHVSKDGKNWGEPICKGEFANNLKEKRVEFDKPVKARYIRFSALSEQNGQDFASGAEITILAE